MSAWRFWRQQSRLHPFGGSAAGFEIQVLRRTRRRHTIREDEELVLAHPEQLKFVELVRSLFPQHFNGCQVLEIGSMDIQGSVRGYFTDCKYVGIDIGPGPGVDVVARGESYDSDGARFDVAVSCECFEHNPEWESTLRNMIRLLKPGGLLVVTCAAPGREEHGTTRSFEGSSPNTVASGSEYYRNLSTADVRLPVIRDRSMHLLGTWTNARTFDTYVLAVKASPALDLERVALDVIDRWIECLAMTPVGRIHTASQALLGPETLARFRVRSRSRRFLRKLLGSGGYTRLAAVRQQATRTEH